MEIDLRQLRAFEVLLRERNLTQAAVVLGLSQPALSKTLARLRRYFADPLFVRVGNRMEPTAKARELEPSVRSLLDSVTMLRAHHRPFDPQTAVRTFSFSVVDSGMLRLLPRLLPHLERVAPGVRLRVVAARRRRAGGVARSWTPRFRDGLVRGAVETHSPPTVVVRDLR